MTREIVFWLFGCFFLHSTTACIHIEIMHFFLAVNVILARNQTWTWFLGTFVEVAKKWVWLGKWNLAPQIHPASPRLWNQKAHLTERLGEQSWWDAMGFRWSSDWIKDKRKMIQVACFVSTTAEFSSAWMSFLLHKETKCGVTENAALQKARVKAHRREISSFTAQW